MARVAIVTGGSRGIGEAISIALRDQGVTVAANFAGIWLVPLCFGRP